MQDAAVRQTTAAEGTEDLVPFVRSAEWHHYRKSKRKIRVQPASGSRKSTAVCGYRQLTASSAD